MDTHSTRRQDFLSLPGASFAPGLGNDDRGPQCQTLRGLSASGASAGASVSDFGGLSVRLCFCRGLSVGGVSAGALVSVRGPRGGLSAGASVSDSGASVSSGASVGGLSGGLVSRGPQCQTLFLVSRPIRAMISLRSSASRGWLLRPASMRRVRLGTLSARVRPSMGASSSGASAGASGRVDLGGCPPKSPTDPGVHMTAHPVPHLMNSRPADPSSLRGHGSGRNVPGMFPFNGS